MGAWVLDPGKKHHRYFEEMTRIPHGSYHEAAYGDYLVQFAMDHNYEYQRDEIGNVIIYKPASPGYEDHPYIALQAHMDMVWAKDDNREHDFFHDPLVLYIENGFLKARGTTLGADDGTGVAYMLAVLADDTLKTPPIEAIFTVQEETGLGGALALKKEAIRSRRLISLDCGGGDSIYISSFAGLQGMSRRHLQWEEAAGYGYCLSVGGLKGGYSDGYKSEQANANQIGARLLYQLGRTLKIRLAGVQGGRQENKIASCCELMFTSDADPDTVHKSLDILAAEVYKENQEAEKNMTICLTEKSVERQMTPGCSEAVCSLLFLFPCGLRHRSVGFPDVMSECINWSSVYCQDDEIRLIYNLRGSADSRIVHMQEEISRLTECFSFTCHSVNSFPAWEFHDSELLHTLQKIFRKMRGKELGLIPVQGGLECGVFANMYPEMDIIAMGPYGYDVHTTAERLDLKNFDELFEVFCRLLEAL